MIWLDATCATEPGKKLHGIARVELETIKASLASNQVKYFTWAGEEGLSEISKAHVIAFMNSEERTIELDHSYNFKPKPITLAQKIYLWVFSRKDLSRFVFATTAYLALFFWRLAYQTYRTAINLFREFHLNFRKEKIVFLGKKGTSVAFWNTLHAPEKLQKPSQWPLSPGDTLVSLGLVWKRTNIQNLFEHKQAQKFKVLFFVYDLIPIRNPELAYQPHLPTFFKGLTDALWVADAIHVGSEYVLADLKKLIAELNVKKSLVLKSSRFGLNRLPSPSRGDLPSKLETERFIVYVSTIEKRKNHALLLEAYKRLLADGAENLPTLILAGSIGWGVDELIQEVEESRNFQVKGENKVQIFSNLSDAQISWLYTNAHYSVFPSSTEGWGLPVSESLSLGTMVIASNHSAIQEAGGEYPIYLDAYSSELWAATMKELNSQAKIKVQAKATEFDGWGRFFEDIVISAK